MLSIIAFSILVSCSQLGDTTYQNPNESADKQIAISLKVPEFKDDTAYSYIKKQVDFGPRIPGTLEHRSCGIFLKEKIEKYSDNLILQETEVKLFDGSRVPMLNIIGEFNPEISKRIMLCAHWDTRPFADQDSINRDQPIDGANDGASGVGILLEIARQLHINSPQIGVDIILFDVEDYGQPDNMNGQYKTNTWCLGSQHWSKSMHRKNYFPESSILLDMVGGIDAKFTMEGNSMKFAPSLMKKLWNIAAQNGYSNYFIFSETHPIIDDHVYINQLAGIPCIDIVHYDAETPSNFGKFWHTHKDNIEIIDKKTLKAVGQTLLVFIYHSTI